MPRFSVYQLGRGSDPVIVVGNTLPAVAFNMERVSSVEIAETDVQHRDRKDHGEDHERFLFSEISAISVFNPVSACSERASQHDTRKCTVSMNRNAVTGASNP